MFNVYLNWYLKNKIINNRYCLYKAKLLYKQTNITITPQRVKHKDKFLKITSKIDGSSSSDPINLYPNKPGKIKEIAVEPVAPTTAKTKANDLRAIANM